MVAASLIATIATDDMVLDSVADLDEDEEDGGPNDQGAGAEAAQYMNGQPPFSPSRHPTI